MIEGSNWFKWDLHIHTPSSIVQHYGSNNDETWEQFIKDLENLPKEFKVIGINDYLFLNGYKKVLDFKEKGRLKNIELILPVVEFRIEKFAGVDFDKLKRINLHIIFSNELSPDVIQSQFLNGLEQSYKLEKDGNEWNQAITKESIEELGKRIKSSVPEEELSKYGSDLEEGFNNLNIDEKKIFEPLKRDVFKDKYLIAIGKTEWDALKWSDSSISTKKTIINEADIVFTAAENDTYYYKAKSKLKEQGVNDLLLDCSDAHTFSSSTTNKDRIGNCYTWIKADRTFDGLKQIIYEPDDRIFVGEIPELIERVNSNKTKFIKSLSINQINDYKNKKGVWFKDIKIPFNYGMVSIIGNKGSGKSAIADIIGLCGNSHHYKDFSFLKNDRFLKGGLARNFNAKLEFASGEIVEKNLSDKVDEYSPERVRYLPQSFFERLTNNLESYDFERTLEELVFSYLPEEEKLGKSSFQDLISFKKDSIKKDIELIEREIKEINGELIEFEKKANPNYLHKLRKELSIKKKELEELEKNKPIEVKNPDLDEKTKEDNEKTTKKIESLNDEKDKIEEALEKKKDKLITLKREIEELKTVKEDLSRFENEIKETISTISQKLNKYVIDTSKILSYKLDLTEINKLLDKKKREYKAISLKLYTKEKIAELPKDKQKNIANESIVIKLDDIKSQIIDLKKQLSTPYKKYQEYLEKLKKWEKDKNILLGNNDKIETIRWYEFQIKYVKEELPKKISEKRKLRVSKTTSILDKKLEVVAIYNKLKKSVDKEIKGHKDILKDYEINIDVALKLKHSFSDDFLSFINKGVKGSFYEIEQGYERIKKLIQNKNFQEKNILKEFLNEIIENLEIDKREGYNNEKRQIAEQIIQEKIYDLYNYLFTINYLEPSYELKLGEKHITELSPGEKGAMLIVFYLMLDKENIPLIIDQPEENLDNESIYKILVHFIKETKKRRQVIMVTHNPNLAIVGDSEQIIYVSIDKKNKNTFSFSSGSIENPKINELSSKILEGTLKAFDIRRLKYFKI